MSEEPKKGKEPAEEWAPAGSAASRAGKGGKDGPELDRLPPPVFPPGTRRSALRPIPIGRLERKRLEGFPENACISPDDPIRRPADTLAEALISPDDPIQRALQPAGGAEEEFGVATGMSEEGPIYGSDDVQRTRGEVLRAIRKASDSLELLARDLRELGTEALVVRPGTPRLDAMLKGFLAGYLVGKGEGANDER